MAPDRRQHAECRLLNSDLYGGLDWKEVLVLVKLANTELGKMSKALDEVQYLPDEVKEEVQDTEGGSSKLNPDLVEAVDYPGLTVGT